MSEQIDFFALMQQNAKTEEPVKEEIKDAEVVEKQQAEEPEKEVKKDLKKEVKKETKKTSKTKTATAKDKKTSFLYPFSIYTEGRLIDIDNYGFEDGKTYKEAEITKIMLAHKHYEFSGTMEYSYIEDDNVIVANAKQHKKG